MVENKFLVSVADVKLYDDQDNLLLNGKTLIDSSITQSIQSQAVFGGKGSQRLYEFNYQKELAVSISDAAFNPTILSIQSNSKVLRELGDYYTSEFVTLDAMGNGVLTQEPVGTLNVQNSNGTFTTIPHTGTAFTYLLGAGTEVEVSYAYRTMLDTMIISASDFPKAAKMVLNADIMTNNGKAEEMQITIPRFKPDGALELSLTHDGVSTTPLAGTTLADNKGNYAYISFKQVDGSSVEFIDIAASPQRVTLEKATDGDSQTLVVYGVRGGIYGIAQIPLADVTYTTDDATIATVANGVITIASTAVVGDSTIIRLALGGAQDIVEVVIA